MSPGECMFFILLFYIFILFVRFTSRVLKVLVDSLACYSSNCTSTFTTLALCFALIGCVLVSCLSTLLVT